MKITTKLNRVSLDTVKSTHANFQLSVSVDGPPDLPLPLPLQWAFPYFQAHQ